jgi:hypothetical protein
MSDTIAATGDSAAVSTASKTTSGGTGMWLEIAALSAAVITSLFGDDDDTEHTYADEAYKAAVERATASRNRKQLAFTMATSITGLPESTFYGVKGYKRALSLPTDSGSTVGDSRKQVAYDKLKATFMSSSYSDRLLFKKSKEYKDYVATWGADDLDVSEWMAEYGNPNQTYGKIVSTEPTTNTTATGMSPSSSGTSISSLYGTDTSSGTTGTSADTDTSNTAKTETADTTTSSVAATNTRATNPVRTAEYNAEVAERTKKIRGEE